MLARRYIAFLVHKAWSTSKKKLMEMELKEHNDKISKQN
jgi:hypothetical protein